MPNQGPRVSPDAIERNRVSSRARYHRDKPHNQKVQKAYRERQFEEREFVGWDGEGYNAYEVDSLGVCTIRHRYMLFGCSSGLRCIRGINLETQECLDLVLEVERENPDVYHVGFAFEYDVNMILGSLPWRMLAVLKITGQVKWKGYRIKHVPHKMFTVSKDGTVATIYDGFGFFHSKYTTALEKYGVGSASKRARIVAGKSRRGHFSWAEIGEVEDYWRDEISLYPELFDCVRTAAYRGGFRIHKWHGPGALASYALWYNGVSKYMSRNVPGNVQAATRLAYAGGRFQAWECGWYEGPVYSLDKNSAYVQAIAEVPNLARGKWVRVDPRSIRGPQDVARFGLYHIIFDDEDSRANQKRRRALGIPERPYPLFHRGENGRLTWPSRVDGWFWSPEARTVASSKYAKFVEAFAFTDDGTYPFKWVRDSYEVRRLLKDPEHYDPAEKAYKWGLAAMYGAFARLVGWDRKERKAPSSHDLAIAGFITSHCRAAIFDVAQYAYKMGGLISVDTDGVTSRVPFPESLVPEGFGDGLGQWKQDEYDAILFWQNGIYWLRDGKTGHWLDAKSRGVPHGVIQIHDALDALSRASFRPPYKPAQIQTTRTRFVGYRQALKGQHDNWRQWLTEPNVITFGGTGKGTHLPPFCAKCKGGEGMHTITHLPPKNMVSTEHQLPWLQPVGDETVGDIDLGCDFFATSDEIFRDTDYDDRL